ncbi:glycosyltransferase family 2 protein [Mucilaginibacter terrae]|uniref:Glycosyltransferase involved in cell wall biosynthesis n=1 Tax=Mucilaginibacter terrae TaxID=1955052 RepID=A0ABU3GYC1_9SPHI|nr:glycosyltransferase family 2 protein [Mucilaginibacter terrae]MDT3404776.1 glycosyltransferase involved in cell wall biosynthesis [Mucilaginibacter terrae]
MSENSLHTSADSNSAELVSVIIPCYNSQNFIHRAINSVFAQTHKHWELILVDNNSADNTLEMLNTYAQKYPGLIKVYQETKKGAPAARNKGLVHAQGEVIQYLDADDELLPGKIEGQLNLMQQQGAQLIAGEAIFVARNGETEVRTPRKLYINDAWVALIKSQIGITSANLFGKAALLSINGWDESLKSSQEYDLMFRMMQNPGVKVAFDQRPLTLIHKLESGISASDDKSRFAQIIDSRVQLRLRIKDFLKQANLQSPERADAVQTYIYDELMRNRFIIPAYVSQKMKSLGMRIPLKVQVKDSLNKIKRTIKG